MVKPIPKKLLIHEVEHKPYTGDNDGWGEEYGDAQTIENVRVEAPRSLQRDADQEQIEGDLVLFIDRINSEPFVEPKNKDKVVFNGHEYEVKQVKPVYGLSSKVHHYEAGLV